MNKQKAGLILDMQEILLQKEASVNRSNMKMQVRGMVVNSKLLFCIRYLEG